jgi:hypothetical protein
MGMDIIQNCEVTGIRREGGKVVGRRHHQGPIGCDKLGIVVPGIRRQLAEMAGFRLPIEAVALQALVSEPIKPLMDVVVMANTVHGYMSQSDKGEMVIGGGADGFNNYTQRGSFHHIEETVRALCETFPMISRLKMLRQWGGIVDMTGDRSPIISKTPVDGVFINCGWGTGGFKAIPGSGWATAEMVAKARPGRWPGRSGSTGSAKGGSSTKRRRGGGALMDACIPMDRGFTPVPAADVLAEVICYRWFSKRLGRGTRPATGSKVRGSAPAGELAAGWAMDRTIGAADRFAIRLALPRRARSAVFMDQRAAATPFIDRKRRPGDGEQSQNDGDRLHRAALFDVGVTAHGHAAIRPAVAGQHGLLALAGLRPEHDQIAHIHRAPLADAPPARQGDHDEIDEERGGKPAEHEDGYLTVRCHGQKSRSRRADVKAESAPQIWRRAHPLPKGVPHAAA